MSEQTNNWPDLAIQLYDRLTGRGAEISYAFDNMEVFVPADVSELFCQTPSLIILRPRNW